MKTKTPELPETFTLTADAAIVADVDYGDAFIRPETIATGVVSRLAEDLSDPQVELDESEADYGLSPTHRHPLSHSSAGVRRAILRVYRI